MQTAPWKNIAMPLKAPTNTLIFQQRWSKRSIFLTFLLHRSYKVCGLQFFHIHGSFVLANLEITFKCLQVLPCEIFRRQLRILLKCAFSISISKLFNRERKREITHQLNEIQNCIPPSLQTIKKSSLDDQPEFFSQVYIFMSKFFH